MGKMYFACEIHFGGQSEECYGLKCVPQNSYVEVSTSSTSDCSHTQRERHREAVHTKMDK